MGLDDLENVHLLNETSVKYAPSGSKRSKRCYSIVKILLCTVLATTTLLQLIFLGLLKSKTIYIAFHGGPTLPPYIDSNYPSVFTDNSEFSSRSPDQAEVAAAAWKRITYNMDQGLLLIPDHERYGLPSSELGSDDRGYYRYPIAHWHAIHCLGTIREIFYTLNVTQEIAFGIHVPHCFDYLRQSLTCMADLTLEYTEVGMDVEHRCKNPKEVERFMEQYRQQ